MSVNSPDVRSVQLQLYPCLEMLKYVGEFFSTLFLAISLSGLLSTASSYLSWSSSQYLDSYSHCVYVIMSYHNIFKMLFVFKLYILTSQWRTNFNWCADTSTWWLERRIRLLAILKATENYEDVLKLHDLANISEKLASYAINKT